MTADLDRLIDSGPRYGVGWDAESSEFLIEDRNRRILIARSGTDAVRELVEQANSAPELARRLKRVGELFAELPLRVESCELANSETISFTLAEARELLKLLEDA